MVSGSVLFLLVPRLDGRRFAADGGDDSTSFISVSAASSTTATCAYTVVASLIVVAASSLRGWLDVIGAVSVVIDSAADFARELARRGRADVRVDGVDDDGSSVSSIVVCVWSSWLLDGDDAVAAAERRVDRREDMMAVQRTLPYGRSIATRYCNRELQSCE